jgi:TPP-dependent pyruvate/acetoin dehydrogenase alpha subunit
MWDDKELTEAEFAHMQEAAQAAVEEATRWAIEQPYPPLDAIYEDIWA